MNGDNFTHDAVRYAADKLDRLHRQAVRCAGLLSDAECWQRANAHCNSVGNLILHLTGNVRQWVLGGLAGEPLFRDRPAEFAARGPQARDEWLPRFNDVVERAIAVLRNFDAAQLGAPRTIQGYDVSGLVAILHVTEHFSFHVGQIVHVTKAIKDIDLSLYDEQGHQKPGLMP